jgi:hypothetical protein
MRERTGPRGRRKKESGWGLKGREDGRKRKGKGDRGEAGEKRGCKGIFK